MQLQVLVVYQDGDIANHLWKVLREAGIEVVAAQGGSAGLIQAQVKKPSLILLDSTLPQTVVLELCRLMKKGLSTRHIPIIILASEATEEERITGFEAGADDFVPRPFSYREIVLRIRNSIRRNAAEEPKTGAMILGEIRLDHARQQVAFRGWSANLTRLELKLMSQLMTNHGQVLKRGELLDLIWGLNTNITARSIDSHVARLRHKLGVLAPYLQTVRSVGFRLSEEIASAGRERDERIPELHRLNFHFKRTRRIELIHARGNESPADLAAA